MSEWYVQTCTWGIRCRTWSHLGSARTEERPWTFARVQSIFFSDIGLTSRQISSLVRFLWKHWPDLPACQWWTRHTRRPARPTLQTAHSYPHQVFNQPFPDHTQPNYRNVYRIKITRQIFGMRNIRWYIICLQLFDQNFKSSFDLNQLALVDQPVSTLPQKCSSWLI